jgi:hypothetical protein
MEYIPEHITITPTGEVYQYRKGFFIRAEAQDKRGYWIARLFINKKRYNVASSRIVFQHYFGDIPDGCEIDHLDGNKGNNNPSNLQPITPRANKIKGIRENPYHKSGENSSCHKLNWKEVRKIRKLYVYKASGKTGAAALAKRFGVSVSQIYKIVHNVNWRE